MDDDDDNNDDGWILYDEDGWIFDVRLLMFPCWESKNKAKDCFASLRVLARQKKSKRRRIGWFEKHLIISKKFKSKMAKHLNQSIKKNQNGEG